MGVAVDLVRQGTEVFHSHDLAQMKARYGDFFAEDCVMQNPFATTKGRGIFAFWEAILGGFPDVHHDTFVEIEQGDWAALEGRFNGTHTGTFRPPGSGVEFPPTGKRVTFDYAQVVRVDNGRMVEWRVYFDSAVFMRQLGGPPNPVK